MVLLELIFSLIHLGQSVIPAQGKQTNPENISVVANSMHLWDSPFSPWTAVLAHPAGKVNHCQIHLGHSQVPRFQSLWTDQPLHWRCTRKSSSEHSRCLCGIALHPLAEPCSTLPTLSDPFLNVSSPTSPPVVPEDQQQTHASCTSIILEQSIVYYFSFHKTLLFL